LQKKKGQFTLAKNNRQVFKKKSRGTRGGCFHRGTELRKRGYRGTFKRPKRFWAIFREKNKTTEGGLLLIGGDHLQKLRRKE